MKTLIVFLCLVSVSMAGPVRAKLPARVLFMKAARQEAIEKIQLQRENYDKLEKKAHALFTGSKKLLELRKLEKARNRLDKYEEEVNSPQWLPHIFTSTLMAHGKYRTNQVRLYVEGFTSDGVVLRTHLKDRGDPLRFELPYSKKNKIRGRWKRLAPEIEVGKRKIVKARLGRSTVSRISVWVITEN